MRERYIAEWVVREYRDKDGEWWPDRDEHEAREYKTLAAAKRAGITNSKRADCAEWVRVARETQNPRHPVLWDEVEIWTGDWQGNWDHCTFDTD